jgi:hypothetical protein
MANTPIFPENSSTPISEVDRIATLTDPVLRNYQITQSYHDLSMLVSKRLGACANWCTFATWASKQAGQTIRGEDLAKALEHHLATEPAISQSLLDIAKGAVQKGSRMSKQGITKLVLETIDPKAAMNRAGNAGLYSLRRGRRSPLTSTRTGRRWKTSPASPDGILQEWHASILCANLAELLVEDAQKELDAEQATRPPTSTANRSTARQRSGS